MFRATYVRLLMSGYLCLCEAHLEVEATRLRKHVVDRPEHRLVVLPCRQQEEDTGDTHFLFSPGSVDPRTCRSIAQTAAPSVPLLPREPPFRSQLRLYAHYGAPGHDGSTAALKGASGWKPR